MITVKPLTRLNPNDLHNLVTGYTSNARYRVSKTQSGEHFLLTLDLVPLPRPFIKRYDHLDAETLERYQQVIPLGFSFGAYEGDQCVGIALAEPRQWNKSLWVWELHVAETHRRRGVGRGFVDALAEKSRAAGLRTIVCETQNTNVPAIRFYRGVGFNIEGIDISYYTNEDYPDGEIAIFMKKRL
jgi:ribosomal protein S18 acetylase RimI-like enzyme